MAKKTETTKRKNISTRPVTYTLESDLLKPLDDYSYESGLTKSKIVSNVLRDFLGVKPVRNKKNA